MIFFSPPEQANYTSGDGHHMRSLDALKGIAILGTVMVHATDSFRMELPKLVGNLTYEGARGVQLFFIIAAFLTFRSLNRRQEKWEGFSGYWKWVLSRYVRLAPLFWLLLISRIALNGGWSHFISNTGDLIGLPAVARSKPALSCEILGARLVHWHALPVLPNCSLSGKKNKKSVRCRWFFYCKHFIRIWNIAPA